MARAATARATAPAPRRAPERAPRRPARPPRRAPATRPAPARPRPAAKRRPVGRRAKAAARLAGIPHSPFVDRLLTGRAWIVLVAVLLAGIVFANVALLEMNAGIARTTEKVAQLKRENSRLRLEAARLGSSERIQRAAADLGLVLPAPGEVRYLEARPQDPALALKRMSEPAPIPVAAPLPVAPVAPDPAATTPTTPTTTTTPTTATTPVEPAPTTATPAPTEPVATETAPPPATTTPPATTGQTG
jgi:cell division protein FtsL